MNSILNIPEGSRDLIFGEVEICREISERLESIYANLGFRPVMTPAAEYYDVFAADRSIPQESMYKLSDNNGRLIAFRADNTLPMVRVSATKLRHVQRPLKLCYSQSIHRINRGWSGRRSEILQSGIEIIGASGMRADLLCISTAIRALEALDAENCKLEIGNVGFYNALAGELSLDDEQSARIRGDVERKNLGKLADYGKIASVPMLYGSGEVFAKARELAGDNAEAAEAVDYTEKLWHTLSDAGMGDRLIVDFGIVHEIDYYTGPVFRGYMEGAGEPVIAGGRYDGLCRAFGCDSPATGFAVNISLAADTIARRDGLPGYDEPRYLVYFEPECLAAAESFKAEYEGHGMRCEYSLNDTEEQTFAEAEKRGIRGVVTIDGRGVRITERNI